MTAGMLSCNRHPVSPQFLFDDASQAFLHGELKQSQEEAEIGYRKYGKLSLQWAWKFRILEAKAALARGAFEDVLSLLDSPTFPSDQPEFQVSALTLRGIAYVKIHNFNDAERLLNNAARRCEQSLEASCGDLFQARGLLASEKSESRNAEQFYQLSLSFARAHADRYLEATSLLNLGAESLDNGRFDEAIDWSRAAYEVAEKLNARVVQLVAQGNVGWADYRLGDSEQALQLSLAAEKAAAEVRDVFDQENELTNIGYIYMDQHKLELAEQSFQLALTLAKTIQAKQDVYNALRVMARLNLLIGFPDRASRYAEQAISLARESNNHQEELSPSLVQGEVAAWHGDDARAHDIFEAVELDRACPAFLKWEAQHSLALLYQKGKRWDAADAQYRAALATFESARATLRQQDFQISFLTNAARIYDDYIQFLMARGKPDEALRWADYSRARTLSEGLGLLTKAAEGKLPSPPPLNPQAISRRAKGTLLFYWLGEKYSYLWTITPDKTYFFSLPSRLEIDSLVLRYRKALNGPQDVLSTCEEARVLYRTLIAPAQTLLPAGGKVFVIPEGSLNNLNFETLVVAGVAHAGSTPADANLQTPHFWIEDADVVNASSLRVLAASLRGSNRREKKRNLLLVGDSISPNKDYPQLPRASAQMTDVARHFLSRRIYEHGEATPASYLSGHPENFSHIHFVAHGTASRLSPLDSAIVLSPDSAGGESFKLYAREIIKHPLRADLVTISACYGAGERAYSGEGLVGLAWAFLRAGAHHVIASLWEVSDASTEQLMDRFYEELNRGASPDKALRTAKLSLLHGVAFRNPFYWAPFQLYTGS